MARHASPRGVRRLAIWVTPSRCRRDLALDRLRHQRHAPERQLAALRDRLGGLARPAPPTRPKRRRCGPRQRLADEAQRLGGAAPRRHRAAPLLRGGELTEGAPGPPSRRRAAPPPSAQVEDRQLVGDGAAGPSARPSAPSMPTGVAGVRPQRCSVTSKPASMSWTKRPHWSRAA